MRTYGLEWTEEVKEKAKRLRLLGLKHKDIAVELGSTEASVKQHLSQMGVVPRAKEAEDRRAVDDYFVEIDKTIDRFQVERVEDDNYMIFADIHSPYHSEKYMNHMLSIADKFNIKKAIIAGDLFDFGFAKFWTSEKYETLDDEIKRVKPIIDALDYFDEVCLIRGNHEFRVHRMTDGKIQARHLFNLFGGDVWEKKFRYSTYDRLEIGEKWLCVHPRSYSQIGGSVAIRLAEKFHRHILNAHGHFIAQRYDRSGKFMGIDLGGMFDIEKVEYINMKTTSHPVWNNGFCMLKDDHIYHFHKETDWDFWLK